MMNNFFLEFRGCSGNYWHFNEVFTIIPVYGHTHLLFSANL